MGCDIHMNIEVKTENGWELYSKPDVERNYRFFAKLANVRNEFGDIEPISAPRGIPSDASYLVRKSYEKWGSDAHSASYITCEEIYILQNWLTVEGVRHPLYLEDEILHTFCEGNSFYGIKRYPDERPDWIFDCRFVFWFDS